MPHATKMCENFNDFVRLHKEQLKASAIPELYWDSLFQKLTMEVYDAGENFMIQQIVEEEEEEEGGEGDEGADIVSDGGDGPTEMEAENSSLTEDGAMTHGAEDADGCSWTVIVTNEKGILKSDPGQIYLIDHSWTYRPDQARRQLQEISGLLPRMCALMDIDTDAKEKDDLVDTVMNTMWKFNQTYNIGNAELGNEEASPIWYVMDEFGSRIQHADDPSVRVIPFYYAGSKLSYSVMWPLRDMAAGDEVTRDFVDGVTDMLTRRLRLLPWQPTDMTHLSFDLQEPDASFFRKYRVHETVPNPDVEFLGLPRDRNIRVYTDFDQVSDNLTDERFEIVKTEAEADILWSSNNMRDFQGLSESCPDRMVNQFPFEMVVTVKNLLAAICRRHADNKHIDHETLEVSPDWLPATFNLSTELSQFVSYFQQREQRGLANYWICKPWNLARALDSHVTDNLNYILRLPDTGPKIACLYVDDPVLIERENIGAVKFDLRFVVILLSVEPLTLCIYNKFLIRYANIPYSLDHFDEYQKHFTVMNYKPDVNLNEVFCEDFIETFESQYPGYPWAQTQSDINKMIQKVFEAATAEPPPKGIGHSPQSRAIYGLDVLLKWSTDEKGERKMVPVVLECNYGPDNTRLVRYYPSFFNDIFSVMFLNDGEGRAVTLL